MFSQAKKEIIRVIMILCGKGCLSQIKKHKENIGDNTNLRVVSGFQKILPND